MRKSVRLSRDEAARKLRTLLQRPRRVSLGPLPLPRSEPARRFWSERAWSEFSAVPAMAQTQLAVVRRGGALDELAALSLIGADEVFHAELSKGMAELLGGYVERVPVALPYQPQTLAEPSGTPLHFWIVGSGCISETISLELMVARLRRTSVPIARAVLSRIQRDEALHTRVAWSMAAQHLPELGRARRRELAGYAAEMIEVLTRSFATFGLRGRARTEARALRDRTAALGLGACPADEEDAVFRRAVEERILPRLRRLGLPL